MRKIAECSSRAATLGVAAQPAPPRPQSGLSSHQLRTGEGLRRPDGAVFSGSTASTAPGGTSSTAARSGWAARRRTSTRRASSSPRRGSRRERGAPGNSERKAAGHPRQRQQESCGSGTRAARGTGRARTPPPSASPRGNYASVQCNGVRARRIDFQPRVEQLRDQHALRAVAVASARRGNGGPTRRRGPGSLLH